MNCPSAAPRTDPYHPRLAQLLEPLQFLGWYYSSLKNCFVDLEALTEILMTKSELEDGNMELRRRTPRHESNAAAAEGNARGVSLDLDGVEYSYQEDRPILRGVSLRVNPGESVAVVGASGSGKSTLLRMILRLYDVSQGKVKVDGIPIRDVKLESLREATALIPQDTLMFNDTIYNVSSRQFHTAPATRSDFPFHSLRRTWPTATRTRPGRTSWRR